MHYKCLPSFDVENIWDAGLNTKKPALVLKGQFKFGTSQRGNRSKYAKACPNTEKAVRIKKVASNTTNMVQTWKTRATVQLVIFTDRASTNQDPGFYIKTY